jgi:hypothetical protein
MKNLELCGSTFIKLFKNHVPDQKYVKVFHIHKNYSVNHTTEPCPQNTNKMVFEFLTAIYQRNILASIIKYILLRPIISTFETSDLMPEKRGIFYTIYQRLCEIIFESVLLAFNGSNYDNYLICNSLITIQSHLKQKIKIFKKGSSISTILLTMNRNIGHYSAHAMTTKNSKQTLNNKWPMKLYFKDVRNLVAANMTLDKIGKLFNLEMSKLCFPYEQATSIQKLKDCDSLRPLDEGFWKNTFSGRTTLLEERLEAQKIFEQKGFCDLYQFSVFYLTQDCLLLHSVVLTLFNTYRQDSINIFLRRNYSQSSLAYQQFFIVDPSKQTDKVLAPKAINNTFYNYMIKQAVTGGLCTSFVHGQVNKTTIINEHFNYIEKPELNFATWPNFDNLNEWKKTFDQTPSGISTIDIRSLYPSAAVKKLPVNQPLFYSRFTAEDYSKLYTYEKFYRTLNLNKYCKNVRDLGNFNTDQMRLVSEPPRSYNEFNALNFYLNSLPAHIQILRFQSHFTAFGQLTFVKYPVDGFLSYIDHTDKKIHLKIIQYQSTYYHGHTEKCPMPNNAEESIKFKNTSHVRNEITQLCNHFTHQFEKLLNPVVFEYIEISDCDFLSHKIPKIKEYLPFYLPSYDYHQFLENIYSQKLTGLLVVRNLKICSQNQNPIFGFIIQKIEYDLKKMSPYTQEQVNHLHNSKRVISVHESKEFMVISTEYFNWLRNTFGFENKPDIYHALLFQLDDYLRLSIENKLRVRKDLKQMIKQETNFTVKQNYEVKAELIKLMLNSCYGFTLCNLSSTKFKQYENRRCVPTKNLKNIVSCFQFSNNVFLVQTRKEQLEEFPTMLGHVGCYILFHSKRILLKRLYYLLMFLNPRHAQLLYMDTDSAHFLVKYAKFEDNVDSCLRSKFLSLYNKHFESGNKISGIWVEEGFFDTGEYLGEKCYRLFNESNRDIYITHMKGLNTYFQNEYHKNNIDSTKFPYLSYNNFFKSPDFLIFKTHMSKNLFTNYVPNKRYFVSATGSLPLRM